MKLYNLNYLTALGFLLVLAGVGCAPTVALQAPDKPLEINLNVKIDHQISVKVDKQLDDVMKNNSGIF
jgi:hypothetical protein